MEGYFRPRASPMRPREAPMRVRRQQRRPIRQSKKLPRRRRRTTKSGTKRTTGPKVLAAKAKMEQGRIHTQRKARFRGTH